MGAANREGAGEECRGGGAKGSTSLQDAARSPAGVAGVVEQAAPLPGDGEAELGGEVEGSSVNGEAS